MMKPMIENMLSVERQAIRASITPINDSGNEAMIDMGWMKLRNCEAKIM